MAGRGTTWAGIVTRGCLIRAPMAPE